jgi:hypothetical protein
MIRYVPIAIRLEEAALQTMAVSCRLASVASAASADPDIGVGYLAGPAPLVSNLNNSCRAVLQMATTAGCCIFRSAEIA